MAEKRRRGRARPQCDARVQVPSIPGQADTWFRCVKPLSDNGTHAGEHDLQPEHSK